MKYILATKLEMTQRFGLNGEVIPVTLVHAGPCVVTQVKTVEEDGYRAIQIGFGTRRRITKPLAGHVKELGKPRFLREVRLPADVTVERGATVDVTTFAPGDVVNVIGTSKGRGFQGVVKRHGFHGSPASHGHKDQLRMPGSIGSKRQGPVQKGKRMAGRMGGDRVTIQNLEIIAVDSERGELAIRGAVPGARGSLLLIQGVA